LPEREQFEHRRPSAAKFIAWRGVEERRLSFSLNRLAGVEIDFRKVTGTRAYFAMNASRITTRRIGHGRLSRHYRSRDSLPSWHIISKSNIRSMTPYPSSADAIDAGAVVLRALAEVLPAIASAVAKSGPAKSA
jgi:hypothetical protein